MGHVADSDTGRYRHRALPALLLLHALEYDQGQEGGRRKGRCLATTDGEGAGGPESVGEDHHGAAQTCLDGIFGAHMAVDLERLASQG